MNAETGREASKLDSPQVVQFARDGFVVLPGFFLDAELKPLREACHADPSIGGRLRAVADSSGNAQDVVEWTTFSDDYLGVIPRLARLIEAAECLLGKPVYHWHSKLSMKAPHSAGRWDWHQDYPYWYDEGCLSPDMLTCMIAVDRATRENGCVSLIAGSHRYGRIDHMKVGASSGCDPKRLELIQRRSPPVPVEMASGDACFFHCNTLHASSGNSSDVPRTLLHCTYNAIDNSPFVEEGQEHHRYRPFEKLPDDSLLEHRWNDVFGNHTFNSFGGVGTVNRYGYQVISRG
jgi:ectoine hydroxylase